MCTVLVNEMARRNLLHEMGHIWIDQNVSRAERDRFLELRGLRTWNASTADWEERGYEQGAEIMAWALGNRILTAQIPDNEAARLAAGFELLTGVRLHWSVDHARHPMITGWFAASEALDVPGWSASEKTHRSSRRLPSPPGRVPEGAHEQQGS